MHFNIIQLCATKPQKEELISESNIYEDPLFLQECEYGGDKKKVDNELLDVIKKELQPFATVNKKEKTIKFYDRKTVEEKYRETINDAVKEFNKDFDEGRYSTGELHLRQNVTELCHIDDLFYVYYCCKFSSIVADYLAGHLPQTLYIGSILDAKR